VNLHAIAAPAVGTINPFVDATVAVSTGYTTAPDGTQQPAYAAPVTVQAQIQPLSTSDIRHIEALNLQNVHRAIYLNGHVDGLVRAQNKGGDLITIGSGPNPGTYLVTHVFEAWPDWVKAGVTMQNGS
jgi:hypothetical protein